VFFCGQHVKDFEVATGYSYTPLIFVDLIESVSPR
jgi:hypothetical protein